EDRRHVARDAAAARAVLRVVRVRGSLRGDRRVAGEGRAVAPSALADRAAVRIVTARAREPALAHAAALTEGDRLLLVRRGPEVGEQRLPELRVRPERQHRLGGVPDRGTVTLGGRRRE